MLGRFGRGYQLKVRTEASKESPSNIKHFIASSFQSCVLKEEYNGELTYQVRSRDVVSGTICDRGVLSVSPAK